MGKHFWSHKKLRRTFAAVVLGSAVLIGGGIAVHRDANELLKVAAVKGFGPAITPLVWLGADENGKNAGLERAAYHGHTDAVASLLKNGADVHSMGDTALLSAASSGSAETVRLLLDKGADVNASYGLALTLAALGGHTGTVTLLLDRGADVHAFNDESLRVAMRFNRIETARVLRERGAEDPKPLPFTFPPLNPKS